MFFGEFVLFQGMSMEFRDKSVSHALFQGSEIKSWRLLTTKSQSLRGAYHQSNFMGSFLNISQICLPCPLSRWVSLFYAPIIGLVMMVLLLIYFWDGEYGFSTVGVGAILGNGCGIQEQNYVALIQRSETTAEFHCRSWILYIKCYRFILWDVSQWSCG